MATFFSRFNWAPPAHTRREALTTDKTTPEQEQMGPPSLVVNDPEREHEADMLALQANKHSPNDPKNFLQKVTGTSLAQVRLHHDDKAAQANRKMHSRAFAHGNDIYFGKGQYQPHTQNGKLLVAHEMAHVAQQQQSGQQVVQRDAIEMDPLVVTPGNRLPQSVDKLSGDNADSSGISVSHGNDPRIEQGSMPADTKLPWTSATAWNADEIASHLGQYDRIPGTDSDAKRCVQAVGLMSHVLMGPAAVNGYLASMALQGVLGNPSARRKAALEVIEYAKQAIANGNATYGHLYWAIEAIHDMFYKDDTGTPEGDLHDQVVPAFDFGASMTKMNTFCNTPEALMAEASKLNKGEQLMLNTWGISFNATFDVALAEKGAASKRLTYNVIDDKGKFIRQTTITRIDTKTKPDPAKRNKDRDIISGHQMLIFKDAATGDIKMYEPELATNGQHLFNLTKDSSVLLGMLFNDQPAFEQYHYVQILGKITPAVVSSGFGM